MKIASCSFPVIRIIYRISDLSRQSYYIWEIFYFALVSGNTVLPYWVSTLGVFVILETKVPEIALNPWSWLTIYNTWFTLVTTSRYISETRYIAIRPIIEKALNSVPKSTVQNFRFLCHCSSVYWQGWTRLPSLLSVTAHPPVKQD